MTFAGEKSCEISYFPLGLFNFIQMFYFFICVLQ